MLTHYLTHDVQFFEDVDRDDVEDGLDEFKKLA
jgi:hypothetical protein